MFDYPNRPDKFVTTVDSEGNQQLSGYVNPEFVTFFIDQLECHYVAYIDKKVAALEMLMGEYGGAVNPQLLISMINGYYKNQFPVSSVGRTLDR